MAPPAGAIVYWVAIVVGTARGGGDVGADRGGDGVAGGGTGWLGGEWGGDRGGDFVVCCAAGGDLGLGAMGAAISKTPAGLWVVLGLENRAEFGAGDCDRRG